MVRYDIIRETFPMTVKEYPMPVVCQILKQIMKYLLLVAQSKESTCNAGDLGSIPGSGRSAGEGNGYPLQYSWPGEFHGQRSLVGYCLRGRKESDMTERLTLSSSHRKSIVCLFESIGVIEPHYLPNIKLHVITGISSS